MSSYIIEGGKRLNGEIDISGSKNASLPIMAASILNKGITKLYNVPDIHDTKMMIEILKSLGCKVKKNKNKVVIDSKNITKYEIPENLMHQMRSSVIFAGAILGRYKKAIFSYPGGCDIGARPIDLHLKGFEKLGVNVNQNYGKIECSLDRFTPNEVNLDFPSVGATENIMLLATLGNGITTIVNAAMEPEIEDLALFLNKMGANIKGAGTNIIKIIGVRKLNDVSYNIMPDRIETGTFLCATAITGGETILKKVNNSHINPIIEKLRESGCIIEINNNELYIKAPKRLKAIDVKTMPYPGFPTDMQSIIGATLCVANGTSIITENIFENRFKYINELQKMGAKIKTEGRTAVIKGCRKIYGAQVNATDLRGGASLIIAGLIAKGITKINNIDYILRGYERIDRKLQILGAKIYLA